MVFPGPRFRIIYKKDNYHNNDGNWRTWHPGSCLRCSWYQWKEIYKQGWKNPFLRFGTDPIYPPAIFSDKDKSSSSLPHCSPLEHHIVGYHPLQWYPDPYHPVLFPYTNEYCQ